MRIQQTWSLATLLKGGSVTRHKEKEEQQEVDRRHLDAGLQERKHRNLVWHGHCRSEAKRCFKLVAVVLVVWLCLVCVDLQESFLLVQVLLEKKVVTRRTFKVS